MNAKQKGDPYMNFNITHKEPIRKPAAILFLLALSAIVITKAATVNGKADGIKGIQGAWITFFDYKSAGLCDKSRGKFTANADAYFKKLKEDGINTVYFHVVPCNDAIYPSKYLPWSPYMFQSAPDYDPLEILVDGAHRYKMSFHAWVNPYRKTMDTIYNPARKSSTDRIVRIVKEIIRNYDVDGIHFDDYFYPSRTKGAQFYNVPVARRKAVINEMVKKVYNTVKSYDKGLLFGISPAGAVEYAESLGCDLTAWLGGEGYIDYIIPQIYWSDQFLMDGKTTTLFTNRLNQWIALNGNDTPMYIGLGLYRGGSSSPTDLGWGKKSNNIVTQIKQLKSKGCGGFVLFSSAYLYADATQAEAKNYRAYIHRNITTQTRTP